MMAISIAKALESSLSLHQPLTLTGIQIMDETPIKDIIETLNLGDQGLNGAALNIVQPTGRKIRFDETIAELKNGGIITEAIGTTKYVEPAAVYFSTLLGREPKPYTLRYQEIASKFLEAEGSVFRVWLEDSFSQLYRGWNETESQLATQRYKNYFQGLNDKTEILVSSQSGLTGVPQDFVDEKLQGYTYNDFKELLPFHLRSPELITALDIVHFCWNCYVVTSLPGIHLVGANTKRHFQVFRKISGSKVTVVLVPQINE